MHRVLIVGGDKRNIYLAEIFNKENFCVSVCGFDEEVAFSQGINRVTDIKKSAAENDIIVFGLPVSFDNITVNTPYSKDCVYLADILKNAKRDALITGGRVNKEIAQKHKVEITDYALRDDFAYLNAVPTAEGAIESCMGEISKTVSGLECMVTGFGKCAEILAIKLKSLNAAVHIYARSSKDLAHANALGFKSYHMSELKDRANKYDAIFNTVPFGIFKKECTDSLKTCCVFVDIASAPGGISEDAQKENFKYRFLPGLPGKYSPYTAAEIIKQVISAIIRESGKDAYGWLLTDSK
ncbi:MAG: hypothetical protein IKJ68_13015 [Clostridia bacterium]|nr:hypothetical protein [Clostridia bacterium]